MEERQLHDNTGVWTIVVAAGSGSRFGGEVPKQFTTIAGQRVVDWSIQAAAAVSEGTVVVLPSDNSFDAATLPGVDYAVAGGATRSESVRAGLAAVPASATVLLVHDAARPLADAPLFERVITAVRNGAQAVVPVADVVDTMRDADGNTVDRDTLHIVQTPQGFNATALRQAHAGGDQATDDATLVAQAGGSVATVPGGRWNIKVTTPDDAVVVAALLEERTQ